MPARETPIEVELPADLLAGMLDRCWNPQSKANASLSARPIMGVPREPNQAETAALAMHGILESDDPSLKPSREFSSLATVLLAPEVSLTLRAWQRGEPAIDLQTNLQFAGKHGVAFNHLPDGRYRLKSQIPSSTAHQFATATFFQKAARVKPHPVEALLGSQAATMFCACVDYLRDGGDESLVNPATLMERMKQPSTDPGKLSTLAPLLTGSKITWDINSMEQALNGLATAGLLKPISNGYRYQGIGLLAQLAGYPEAVDAVLHWHHLHQQKRQGLLLTNLVAILFGESLLVTLESCENGQVVLRTPDAMNLSESLPVLKTPRTSRNTGLPAATVEKKSPPPLPKAPSKDPVPATMSTCSSCQTVLHPGAKFCHSCGQQVEKSCASCRAPLRDGAAFCTECGAPVK